MFWDFKNGKLVKRLRAHREVVINHVWLPHESVSPSLPSSFSFSLLLPFRELRRLFFRLPRSSDADFSFSFLPLQSKVITASWDGTMKLWVRSFILILLPLVSSRLVSFADLLSLFTPTGLDDLRTLLAPTRSGSCIHVFFLSLNSVYREKEKEGRERGSKRA